MGHISYGKSKYFNHIEPRFQFYMRNILINIQTQILKSLLLRYRKESILINMQNSAGFLELCKYYQKQLIGY